MKFSKIAVAIGALMLPAVVGCSNGGSTKHEESPTSGLGSIDMMLTLPSGRTINTLEYSITNSNGFSRTGTVPVGQSTTAVEFEVGAIPAGSGYTITLDAETTDGVDCESQPVTFNVDAGRTTSIMISLRCGGDVVVIGSDAGNVRVDVDVVETPGAQCPAVDGTTTLPAEVLVGGQISLTGYATTSTASFSWSATPATAGTFSSTTGASTLFTCTQAGTHQISLAVTGPAGCPQSNSLPISIICTPNGAQPDAGLDSAVPDAAQPDAAEPDAAEPDAAEPDAAEPDSAVPDAAEPDAAEPDAAEPDAAVPDAAEPDAATPDAATPDAATPDASTPDAGPTVTCESCRQNTPDYTMYLGALNLLDGCFVAKDLANTDGSPDPAWVQDCTNVVTCARQNGCAEDSVLGPAGCYCGVGADPNVCSATGPAAGAACVEQWRAAGRSSDNTVLQGRFVDLNYPVAWAFYVLDLDRQFCSSAATGDCTVP